ncbi:uncharacterized protein PG986_003895 [Apiospora aurea]|uniref:Uncharacterized protein n=1 Tax=Apiospora aurea TaxID=335848 RepID=A0ABR1QL18_9PEZI
MASSRPDNGVPPRHIATTDGQLQPTRVSVEATQSIPPVDSPTDSRWLAQLQPDLVTRLPYARGILWCNNAGCGTSRGRRREALLARMLEHAFQGVAKPKFVGLMDRSEWIRFVFWWFWTKPTGSSDDKSVHQWTQLELRQRAILFAIGETTIVPNSRDIPYDPYASLDEMERRRRRFAAICLAITLYDYMGPYADEHKVDIKSLDRYEDYLTGAPRRQRHDFRRLSFQGGLSKWLRWFGA